MRHFYALATREHAVSLSYAFVKKALQGNYTHFFGPGGVLEQEDSEAWMQQYGDVRDVKVVTLIDEYARLREKSAMLLFDLTPEEWLRTGDTYVRNADLRRLD